MYRTHQPAVSRSALWALSVLLALLFSSTCAAMAAQAADPLSWSAPQVIDQTHSANRLNGVTCPSTSLCVAVDESGHVLTSTNPAGGAGAWSAPVSIDPGKALDQVSCPSTSLCVAVDDDGNALVSTDPSGGASAWKVTKIDPNAEAPLGGNRAAVVDCPTTSFCVVVDTYNDIITTTEPTGGASSWMLSGSSYRVITNWGVVACPSTSLCITTDVAAESGNYFYGSTEPAGGFNTWKTTGSDTNYSPGGAEIGAAACPSTELCVMADDTGHVLTTTKPGEGPWTNTNLPTTTSLRGVTGLSCASTSFCVAVDAEGEAITTTDPAGGENAWTPADVDGTNFMTAVSCPTTSFCVAADENGNVIASTDPAGGSSAWTSFRVDESAVEAALSFVPAFSPSQFLGEGSTLDAQFTFTGSEYHGSPDPVTEVVVHLPTGVGGTSAGFPTCSESQLYESGTAGCPAGSLAGPVGSIGLDIESGGVVIERVHETGTIQPVFADKENTNDDFFFYIEAPGVQTLAPAHYVEDMSPYGRALKLELPLIESIPAQPFVSITSLTLTLGASREEDGQLISSLTIPQECPGGGMFPWAADVTYTTNASFTEQTHEHTTAETVCPASSGKSATTTTLLASPASPHVGEVVSYTATVTPKTLGATVPSGSATFLDEGKPIVGCTAQALVPSATVATTSCQLSYSASGPHQVTARYGGDSGYFGSESIAQAVTVGAAEPPHEEPKTAEAPKAPPVVPQPITGAQLTVMLSRQLVPAGTGPRIGALLKSGGYSATFQALEAGTLTVQWYEVPKGAKLAKKVKAKPVLIASGQITFSAAGTGGLKLRLTAQGKRLLKHAKRLKLVAKGMFTRTGAQPISAVKNLVLRR